MNKRSNNWKFCNGIPKQHLPKYLHSTVFNFREEIKFLIRLNYPGEMYIRLLIRDVSSSHFHLHYVQWNKRDEIYIGTFWKEWKLNEDTYSHGVFLGFRTKWSFTQFSASIKNFCRHKRWFCMFTLNSYEQYHLP